MEDKEMYERGEVVIFDYADDEPRIIWGLHFEIGDAIAVLLSRNITQGDLLREMGSGGPWAWGGFRTEWIESLAERIEWLYDNRVLYSAPSMMDASSETLERIQVRAANNMPAYANGTSPSHLSA